MNLDEPTSLSSEDLRRYDNRSGFDLVSCQEVGLPVYKLTVDALTQIRKPIPPIEEYVLQTINIGLSSEEEIAEFLGLELPTVREAMVNLRIISEDIDLVAPDASQLQVWKLTKKGEKTLQEARIIVPEERTFEINFDGLLQIPRWYGRLERGLLKPKNLRDEGLVEIEPSPKRPPELSDLKLKDIDNIIRQIEEDNNGKSKIRQERDLLALKAIERKPLFFQPATALVYKAKDSHEIQVAFIVDGIPSTEHETAFARSNGVKKLRIAEMLTQSEPRKLAEEILGHEFVAQADADQVATLKKKVTAAQAKIQAQIETTQEKIEQTEDDQQKQTLNQQLQDALKQIEQFQTQLNLTLASVPMQWLEMYEHRPLLEQALKDSQERLMIISPWIRAKSVNRWFLQQFENLLKRGVQVFIGYGLGEKDENRYPTDIQAEESLQKLARQYSKTFKLKRLGDTHAKILIVDTKFAVSTSFNWLSFKGERDRTFRDERGTLVSDPQKIDELFNNLLRRFTSD
ncbi:phospholipase D-like domain-containing protein [Nostoc sp.]